MSTTSNRDVAMTVHAAREGDGYWRGKGGQWSLLCPHMSSTAKVGLGILCSLTGQTHPVRVLTAAQFAGLLSKGPVMPGEAPKGMSTGGAIRVLRELADLGQITRPDGSRLTISSRPTAELSICIWTRPRHDCGCARNVHDALNVMAGEDPWFPPAGAGENSDHASKSGQNSHQSGENSDQSGQNSAKTPPLTCDDAPPSSLSSSSSSLSGHGDSTSGEGRDGERETAAPPTDQGPTGDGSSSSAAGSPTGATGAPQSAEQPTPGPIPAQGADSASQAPQSAPGDGASTGGADQVELVLAGWAAGAGVQRPPVSLRGRLAAQVVELAAEYRTDAELRAVAEFAGSRRWFDLGRAAVHPECGKRLAQVRPGRRGGGREMCPDHPRHPRNGCVECALAVPA